MSGMETKRAPTQSVRKRGAPQAQGAERSASALRAAVYLRVSTGRQAEHDLSIPDQKAQTAAWASARGMEIVAEYVEPGASATDDKRPEFQRMIERACDGENAFDVIVVHSFSRFFRDAYGLEFYLRKLAKHGVKLVSITQELGDDPAQVMMRQVIALFDEYQSKENAKHVLRAMKENTRQGFWNGSQPPLGYKVVETERRGGRAKKKLAVDPVDAETVRLMFKLVLEGHQGSGPMGIKAITVWLNAHGYRTRTGGQWGVGRVHGVLTNPVYSGRLRFNRRNARTGKIKDEAEHVHCEAEAIVSATEFDAVQNALAARNPRVAPPRVVSGPILLTGLATCATCGASMALRAGTSRSGEVYRYYSCNSALTKGKTACKGRSIRMDKLDRLVTGHLTDHLLDPARLAEKQGAVDRRIAAVDAILKERITSLKATQDAALAALERAQSGVRATERIGPVALDRFARLMRERIGAGEIPLRKAYIRSIVDRIEVDDAVVRIMGRKDVLEQAVRSGGSTPPVVHGSVPKWWTSQEKPRTKSLTNLPTGRRS